MIEWLNDRNDHHFTLITKLSEQSLQWAVMLTSETKMMALPLISYSYILYSHMYVGISPVTYQVIFKQLCGNGLGKVLRFLVEGKGINLTTVAPFSLFGEDIVPGVRNEGKSTRTQTTIKTCSMSSLLQNIWLECNLSPVPPRPLRGFWCWEAGWAFWSCDNMIGCHSGQMIRKHPIANRDQELSVSRR